jgi:signal transduction histidine kinase
MGRLAPLDQFGKLAIRTIFSVLMLKTALKNSRLPISLMAAGAVVLLVIVATSVHLAVRTAQLTEDVLESRVLRSAATLELETLLNLETGQRGYLLTGQNIYLEPYSRARERSGQVLANLDELTRRDAKMHALVDELRLVTEAKLEELDNTIALYKQGRRNEAYQVVRSNRGKNLMDRGRSILSGLSADAEQSVVANIEALNRNSVWLRSLTVVGGILIAVFSLCAIVLMLRSVRDAVRARTAVENMNASLEERVSERTIELTRANDEIQRFAYIVSHDLRSPLVNVMGFTSELEIGTDKLQKYLEADDPALRPAAVEAATKDLPEAVKFIRTATAKMDRLINAILKLSREGRRELVAEQVDLGKVFETIVQSLQHQIADTGTTVEVPLKLPTVYTDRLALEQVFGNLMDNAIKYLAPGRPGHLKIAAQESGSRVTISIADNGRGIAENDLERIFELFRRAGRQDKPGEGIGLAHVRALIRRLGGDIAVTSLLGEGSEFRVVLPKVLPRERNSAA